ncbi:MAG: ATP-binding protein [Chitinophagales bacterium]
MNREIIGRENETQILGKLLQSRRAELLAIYGRRRVGKTYLIKTYYKEHLAFSCSGQYNGKTREQLINFTEQLNAYFPGQKRMLAAATWQEAFGFLRAGIDSIGHGRKKVIFFDELPWLDSHKSGFVSSFSYFWNAYAEERNDLLFVICGSAASWIIDKIVNNKGGLHNRITQRIRLLPFTLLETEQYLAHKNIKLERYQLLQLYMVMGGVPAYLDAIERGKSAAQNIEKMCFSKDGVLTGEFENLYAALFNRPEKHIQVIEALAKKNKGLTRAEILKTGKLLTGGGITSVLNELTESGFIERLNMFGNVQKESVYHLTDEYSLFYFKFMQHQERAQWLLKQTTPSYTSWCGYAFENISLKHIAQIKRALQIGAVQTTESSWSLAGNKERDGAQIDLLIDRADQTITFCEIKFSTKPFVIDKKYAAELRHKVDVFRRQTNTRKALLLTFITTYGIAGNEYKEQLADGEITMEALFT